MIISVGDITTTVKYLEDYLKTSLGDRYNELAQSENFRILLQLIAIAVNYSQMAQSIARQESYIETAKSETSLIEIVYNYGFVLPPLKGRTLKVKTDYSVELYSPIGTLGDYQIIPVDYYEEGVICKVGYLEETSMLLTTPYQRQTVINKGKFLSDYDTLTEGINKINLANDIVEQIDNPKQSVLRGSGFYQSRLFFGDGKLGYYRNTTVTYKRISYNADVNSLDSNSAQFTIPDAQVVEDTLAWTYYNLDVIRNILKYVPLDARLVREKDFESWLVWRFPQIPSARCFKVSPDDTSYCCEADLEFILLDNSILDYVKNETEKRKLLALKINYIPYQPTQGEDLNLSFKVRYVSQSNLENLVNDYLQKTLALRLMTPDEYIDPSIVALELSEKFYPTVFTPVNTDLISPTPINRTGFFKSVTASLTEV